MQAPPGLFSVLTAVWDGSPLEHFRTLAESIIAQQGACEWVIVDNGCRSAGLVSYLEELSGYGWVKLLRSEANLGITRGLRMCLEQASGRYVLPVDADDVLYPDAFAVIATQAIHAGYPLLLYTDEDKIMGRQVYQPYLKPDWDPVLLLNLAYIAHLGILDRRTAVALGVYSDEATEGSPDWDAFVRFLIAGHEAIHIPEVVYSWRIHAQSTADDTASKSYIHSSQQAVLQRFLEAQPQGRKFEIQLNTLFGGAPHFRFVRRREEPKPIATVVIEDSTAQARSLTAVAQQSEFVHLVGADVQIDDAEWKWEALGLFELHPEVVMIGGCLRTSRGVINDGGRCFGFAGVYGCPYRGVPASNPGYFGELWKQRSVSAVSTQFAVLRSDFLLALLDGIPERASLDFLGAWAGAYAWRTGKRVVYSPFLRATSDTNWDAKVQAAEVALFEEAHSDIIPDRRFYSQHFSLLEPYQLED